MTRTRIDKAHRQSKVTRQLTFKTYHRLQCVRRSNVLGQLVNCHRRSKSRERRKRWHIWKQVQHGRISNDELLLIYAVEAIRRQGQIFSNPVIENPEATANDRFRLALSARPGCPGKTETRSKVQIAFDVVLILVAQAKIQRQVRSHLPVVLNKSAKIELANLRFGIPCGEGELRGASAHRPYLFRRQSLLLQQQSALIALDTGRSETAGEGPRATKVLRRHVSYGDMT